MPGFVICEYEKVKEQFPEYDAVMTALRNALISKAESKWGLKWAGRRKIAEAAARINPATGVPYVTLSSPGPGLDVDVEQGEFGETTIIPSLFNGYMAAFQPLVTWEQWFNLVGSPRVILTGTGAGGTILEDYMVGICGLAFLSKAIRISEVKMQISDKKLPRFNIEEVKGYNKPAMVLEEGYILDEETGFELIANVTTQGPQRIKPIGLQVNRVKDRLLTATGSALL